MTEIRVVCEICHEPIALADTETLKRPMRGSMFKTIDAWHGVPDPFDPAVDWEAMRCPFGRQHRPFISEEKVLTDSGLVVAIEYPDPPKPLQEPEQEDVAGEPFICEVCGRQFGRKRFLSSHMRAHNG